MELMKISVGRTSARVIGSKGIAAGTVGGQIAIQYEDPSWNGLSKKITFRSCCVKTVANVGNMVKIPAEVVAHPGHRLMLGITGVSDAGYTIIPTVWTDLGLIYDSSESSDDDIDVTPPFWAQLMAAIGDLNSLQTASKESVVTALNELVGGLGDLDILGTAEKESLVAAVNELLNGLGDVSSLSTGTKKNLVLAVNELLRNIGDVSTLTTAAKKSLVLAVNELVSNLGDISALDTGTKENLVAATNEVLRKLGDVSKLDTKSKESAVGAINELLSNIGDISVLSTSAKASLVLAVNELMSLMGGISELNTAAKTTLVAAINEVLARIATDIATHNTSADAHSDLRLQLQNYIAKVDAILDSDDATLDELKEVVDYIKSNRDLIDAITVSKVSVEDIVDNLVTNVANRPLSAAQGVILKDLIDTLRIAVLGKAPAYHAVDTQDYGLGSGSVFGHVKLSDETDSIRGIGDGYAATPAAVRSAYSLASSCLRLIGSLSSLTTTAKGNIVDAINELQSGKLDANKLADAIETALRQASDSGEFDGTSVTHSWKGTVLTVTSASGTSSADLKGEKGDPGTGVNILGSYNSEAELNAAHPIGGPGDAYLINGDLYTWSANEFKWINAGSIQGPEGDPGYTPKKGVDYWTPADKTEIAEEVKKTVSPEAIGAVAKTGDTMTGALEIKPTANPHRTKLNKNSVNGEDYGTVLDDFNENNGNVSLTVSALDDKMTFTNLDGDEFEVAHAGNLQELLCTNLGYIEDIADYDASTVEELLDMLVEPGKYTFTDEKPYQYFVEVREGEGINDPMVFQSYWSTEHGLSRILFRTGNLGGDEPDWGNWTCLNTGVTDLGTFPEFCESAMSNNRIFFEEGRYRFVDIEENDISVTVERIGNEVYQTYWTTNDPMLINRRACFLRSGVFNPNTVKLGEFEVYSPAGVNEMIVELDWEKGEASKSEVTINVHLERKGATVMAKDKNGFYGLAYVDDTGVYFNYSDTTYVKVDGWTITKVEKSGGSGGANVLTVTLNEDGAPNVTMAEVYNHVQNGGVAILAHQGNFYYCTYCDDETTAYFTWVDAETMIIRTYCVTDEGYDLFDQSLGGSSSGGANVLIVTVTGNHAGTATADKTGTQIHAHVVAGGRAQVNWIEADGYVNVYSFACSGGTPEDGWATFQCPLGEDGLLDLVDISADGTVTEWSKGLAGN